MKKRRFTRFLSLMIEDDAYDKVKRITDDCEISISEWLRELVYKELESVLVETETVVEDSKLDQGMKENEKEFDLNELVKDCEKEEQLDDT